jgi:hypothetical protein
MPNFRNRHFHQLLRNHPHVNDPAELMRFDRKIHTAVVFFRELPAASGLDKQHVDGNRKTSKKKRESHRLNNQSTPYDRPPRISVA